MRVLALDTTTRDGSAALVVDDRVIDERRGDPARTHAERLPNELIAIVSAREISFLDIDLFAVAAGPGSFTGLRIGIATIQGMAFVHRKRVVALSALDALAIAASRSAAPGTIVGSWMDGYRQDVFASLYEITDAPPFEPERLRVLEPPTVGPPADVLERWRSQRPQIIVGDGAVKFRASLGAWLPPDTVVDVPPVPALAGVLGLMAVARARRGETIDPAAIQPLYIRRPDAEIDRDRRAQGTRA